MKGFGVLLAIFSLKALCFTCVKIRTLSQMQGRPMHDTGSFLKIATRYCLQIETVFLLGL